MKKAFIDILNGTILGHCFLEETINTSYDPYNTAVVLFDENTIDTDYLKGVYINDAWTIEEDTEKKNEDLNINLELKKMEYGKEVLAYIGVALNSLNVEQYQSLLADNNLAIIQTLLRQGALESCHALLLEFTPSEIIPQLLLDKVQMKIQHYINQL